MKIINDNINEARFKRVYLLCGPEDYLRHRYRDKLRSAICGDDDMNYSYYEGKPANIHELIETCETLPFFAERRLVVIEDSGLFKSACDDALIDYIENIPEYLTIVFVDSEVDKRSRLYKAVSKNGYISQMNIQSDEVLKKWVSSLIAADNKRIDSKALQLFIEYAGSSMDNIRQELEKLICYTYGKDEINTQDIEAVCTVTTENKIFDMVGAVAAGQQKKALELYYDLLTLKEAPMRILFLIVRQFNLILQVLELKEDGYTPPTMAKKMGVAPFIVNKCLDQAKLFTKQRLREALETCASYEEAFKTGRLDEKLCVELIIIKYSSR